MKLSIPFISFLQDGSVHHLYVSNMTILVYPNAELLTDVVIPLGFFQAIVPHSCYAMLLRGCLELFPNIKPCIIVLVVLFVLGRRQHQMTQQGCQDVLQTNWCK